MGHALINKRDDLKFYLLILNLIIHYELKNFILLNYKIKSAYRTLLKQNRLYKTEQAMLSFFRKIPDLNTQGEHNTHLINLRNALLSYRNEQYEKNAFEYFDFLEWVESH